MFASTTSKGPLGVCAQATGPVLLKEGQRIFDPRRRPDALKDSVADIQSAAQSVRRKLWIHYRAFQNRPPLNVLSAL